MGTYGISKKIRTYLSDNQTETNLRTGHDWNSCVPKANVFDKVDCVVLRVAKFVYKVRIQARCLMHPGG
jgi:hypothetical protein